MSCSSYNCAICNCELDIRDRQIMNGKCIVIYDESLLAWRIRGLDYEGLDDLCEYADSEIIGNIHDNPELLEATE